MLAHPGAQSLEDVADERIAVTGDAVVHPFSIPLGLDQAGPPQPGEMARDLRLIDPEGAMEIADADFVLGEEVQQAQPGGIGERLEEELRLDRVRFLHRTTYTSARICVSRTHLLERI